MAKRTITCPECGQEFQANHARRRYCDSKCKSRAVGRRIREAPRQCKVTGCPRKVHGGIRCPYHYRMSKAEGISLDSLPLSLCPSCKKGFDRVDKFCSESCASDSYSVRKWAGRRLTCRLTGCEADRYARGYCHLHYHRVLRTGGTDARTKAPNGEGGPWLGRDGYVRMRTPDGRRLDEHRFVMEEVLGRPLERFENVHHINGVKHDNRPENLELWVTPQPAGQRPEDLVMWVVDNYPDLVEAELNRSRLFLAS